ncbi:MAG: carboxylesterase family protein, partial [Proteobacteria bacterium]|nr:carboxylesterase family protein [Pseudomonadota bacterium]
FGLLPRIKDLDAFNSTAAYGSDNWKALAVDEAATRITDRGGKSVYAYRWDWDEGGKNFLVDFSTLLGASHGLEVPFIFGNFDGAIGVPGLYTDENIQGRDILAAQMRSYWTQFAHTGEPGKGRSGKQPLWLPWGASENNLMLLDSPSGGGLRMVDEPMTIAMLKERVAEDNNIPDLRERCSLYVEMFLLQNSGDDTWDEESYEAMGCGIYEPWSLESRG